MSGPASSRSWRESSPTRPRPPGDSTSLPSRPGADGTVFDGGDLLLFHPLRSGGERIGSFYLRSDMAELRQRLVFNLATVGFVLLGATIAILYLSRKLGALVTEP